MSRNACSAVFTSLALSLAVAGCVTSRPVALPNGTQGLAIDCSQGGHDIADCMNFAAETCGGPYRIFGQESHSTPTATSPTPGQVIITNSVARILIVQCGKEE